MSDLIGAIDLGSTKIAVVIANLNDKNEELELIGFSMIPSRGISYGVINDIQEASNCIKEAVQKAIKIAGIRVSPRMIATISGEKITAVPSRGMIIVKSREQEVTEADVRRAIEAAKATSIPDDREVIYHVVRGFRLDGQNGIINPVGMVGTRLESDLLLVTHDKVQLRNVINAFQKAEVNIEGFIPQEIAASEVVLTNEEKKLGVVLVDIGGDLTNLAVFREGYLYATGILKLGGERITKDIAITLKIPTEEAERAKKILGTLRQDREESLEVLSLQQRRIKITTSQVREIIQPRVEEILDFILKKLEELNSPIELVPGGIVITGGTALLDGLEEFAQEYLGVPVRVCRTLKTYNIFEEKDAVFYSSAVGALERAVKTITIDEGSKKFLDYLKEIFKNIFSPFKE